MHFDVLFSHWSPCWFNRWKFTRSLNTGFRTLLAFPNWFLSLRWVVYVVLILYFFRTSCRWFHLHWINRVSLWASFLLVFLMWVFQSESSSYVVTGKKVWIVPYLKYSISVKGFYIISRSGTPPVTGSTTHQLIADQQSWSDEKIQKLGQVTCKEVKISNWL